VAANQVEVDGIGACPSGEAVAAVDVKGKGLKRCVEEVGVVLLKVSDKRLRCPRYAVGLRPMA
jgi:hypothetical protein